MTNTTSTTSGLHGLDLFIETVAYTDVRPQLWDQSDWLGLAVDGAPYDYSDFLIRGREVEDGSGTASPAELSELTGHECGTAGCIAGTAVALAGLEIRFPYRILDGVLSPRSSASRVIDADGDERTVWGAAQALLGLETTVVPGDLWCIRDHQHDPSCYHDGEDLFAGDNSRDDIITIGAQLYGVTVADLQERIYQRAAAMRAETIPAASQEEIDGE